MIRELMKLGLKKSEGEVVTGATKTWMTWPGKDDAAIAAVKASVEKLLTAKGLVKADSGRWVSKEFHVSLDNGDGFMYIAKFKPTAAGRHTAKRRDYGYDF